MTLTASGIGSGLDVNGLVKQLMAVEAQPLAKLDSREASYQAKLSGYGQVKSALASIQSALSGLNDLSPFRQMKAMVGDGSLASASASTSAVKGSYSLEVMQLAQSQRIVTSDTTAPTIAAGTLTFSFGRYVTDDSGPTPVITFTAIKVETVTLAVGKTSLSDLRDAINEAKIGVTAGIVNNGTTEQLIFTGNQLGENAAFKLEGTEGLSGLSYDQSSGAASSTLALLETAQDAKIKLDGVMLKRSSNTISDAIESVTLNLLKADPGKSTVLSVNPDRSAVRSAIDSLVKAYNDFHSTMKNLVAVDVNAKTRGVLTGDAMVRGIETQIRSAFGAIFKHSDGVQSLSDLGISFTRDGTLTTNGAKLDLALNDPDKKVADFFTGTATVKGFAASLQVQLEGYLKTGGALEGKAKGINDTIDAIGRDRTNFSRRLETIEKRYRAQFTALDIAVGKMQQTSNWLSQQLANLPKLNDS